MFRQLKYETPINFKPFDQSRAKRGFGVSEKTGPLIQLDGKNTYETARWRRSRADRGGRNATSRRMRHGFRCLVEVSFQRRRQLSGAHGHCKPAAISRNWCSATLRSRVTFPCRAACCGYIDDLLLRLPDGYALGPGACPKAGSYFRSGKPTHPLPGPRTQVDEGCSSPSPSCFASHLSPGARKGAKRSGRAFPRPCGSGGEVAAKRPERGLNGDPVNPDFGALHPLPPNRKNRQIPRRLQPARSRHRAGCFSSLFAHRFC